MKSNDNFKRKIDINYLNKFDFTKNDSFGHSMQNKNTLNNKEYNKNIINKANIDPRLEVTLSYLDINSTLPTFITNNISFNDLLLLSKKDLIELGFSLVERNRILHFSQEYKRYGKKYNIQEINNFFDEFQNLNMKSVSMNNTNNNYSNNNDKDMQFFSPNERNDINNNINNVSENIIFNNNKNFNLTNNFDNQNADSLYLEDKQFTINYSNRKNSKNPKNSKINNFSNKNLFPRNINNNIQMNKNYNNYNDNNNDIKSANNYISSNKSKNKNMKQESINNNYQDNNSSNLIRQNSKASKNSSYSKNSKSRLFTLSKNFSPPASSSGSIVQKYQDISEQIDNYFKKYNNYQEQKKIN